MGVGAQDFGDGGVVWLVAGLGGDGVRLEGYGAGWLGSGGLRLGGWPGWRWGGAGLGG